MISGYFALEMIFQMKKREVLSILITSLGITLFGLGVYAFHYLYHTILTLLFAFTGSLLIDVGIAYFCEQEASIKALFRVGIKKTKDIKQKIPRKRRGKKKKTT